MIELLHKIKRNLLWILCSRLPKNPQKAVCQSFYGRGFSDSPKAVALELQKRGYQVYWVVKGGREARSLPSGILPLKAETARDIYHQCTAGIWVDSCRKWAYTKKGKNQLYVQTWHGFPLKRIEKDARESLPRDYIIAAQADSAMCDLFLSNSRFLSELYRNSFWYSGEILEQGFPRNDILCHPAPGIAERVRESLSLPADKKLLLYAPTFRRDKGLSVYDVDYERCVGALKRRFGGEWLILAKLHPNIAEKAGELKLNPEFVRNASDYPDIQELYLASDGLLSDYSSVMFDYIPTGKPCFLYVNDAAAYAGDRNFYFDLRRLPYPRAKNNEELERCILEFREEDQLAREEAFKEEFGFTESGKAAAACADWLVNRQKSMGGTL